MTDTLLQCIDDIHDDSLIVEYEVIQALCNSYIKEAYANQYILEDGESSDKSNKDKKSDDKPNKPPSFIERAFNFIRRLIIRIKSFFTIRTLNGYKRLFDRNEKVFEAELQIKLIKLSEDPDYNFLDDTSDTGKKLGLGEFYVLKKSFIKKSKELLQAFIAYTETKCSDDVLSYTHNTNYERLINGLNIIETKVNNLFNSVKSVNKGMSRNSKDIEKYFSENKDLFEKTDYRSGEQIISLIMTDWAPNFIQKTQKIYFDTRDVEKKIKTAKEIENLYNESKDKNNLAYYTKYVTKYIVILDKLAASAIKILSISSQMLKVLGEKVGVKNFGTYNRGLDMLTGEIIEDESADTIFHSSYKDLKKRNVSKKDWRAAT